jgi:hypothetical protein
MSSSRTRPCSASWQPEAEGVLKRLLRLAASLEEAIILLEQRGPHENARTVMRLRVIQGEILSLLHDAEGDSLPVD